MNFAVVFGASLWSGYALPACHPENGTTTATGRGSTYQGRKSVQTKPATSVFADAGYTGADKRPEHEERDGSWNIAVKRSIIKTLPKGLRDLAEPVERALSQVRAWVEHPFHIVKNLFRHKKLRYRGLAKNTAQLHTLFALANLVIVKKTLLAQALA